MNKAILIGRLTKEPETRTAANENNTTVTRFNIAVDRRNKREGEQTADFINCVAFGKIAEFIDKYFTKGSKIVISGRIQTGSYTNKDGVKVYTTDIVVEEAEFAESKGSSETKKEPETDSNGFMNIPDDIADDLPFN